MGFSQSRPIRAHDEIIEIEKYIENTSRPKPRPKTKN